MNVVGIRLIANFVERCPFSVAILLADLVGPEGSGISGQVLQE